jgi:histidinol phosphatase-like PHP family hydrolase
MTPPRSAGTPRRHADVNAVAGGLLRDLAFVQTSPQRTFGYKRAAAAVLALERPLTELRQSDGTLARMSGIGPASSRVILEVLDLGSSPTVERAIELSGKAEEISKRRALRAHFLSRAEVVRVLSDSGFGGPTLGEYRGDLQMHSVWSDGSPTLDEIVDACIARGYSFAAVTDHSYGLAIAGGMSMEAAAEQWREIQRLNTAHGERFRLIRGVEANIGSDGRLDLSREEAALFELVLAAPHSKLRKSEDQTDRLIAAVRTPGVHILAHPRGRMAGTRAGVMARWDDVFAEAAACDVAVEIDGDPARQDLDYTLAARALAAGCLFALDSDAHTTNQLRYADTAIAHARLAGIPRERIVNCWPTDRLQVWLSRSR